MQKQHLQRLFDVRKLVAPEETVIAYCNAFEAFEEREEGNRLRPIMEPLINDLFSKSPEDLLFTTTKYTSKDSIRRGVLRHDYACQFDFSAWFDQIPLHEDIRKFFGVKCGAEERTLAVIPMGYRPSCEIAEAVTDAISNLTLVLQEPHTQSTCVDNVLYQADTPQVVEQAARLFLARCAHTGARVKDPLVKVVTSYDFIGEHYDHERKTRALTVKTALKCEYAAYVTLHRQHFTLRQVMALVGLLLYAASTLRLVVGHYHEVLRFLGRAATGGLDEKLFLPREVRHQMHAWASLGATNAPCPVHHGTRETDITVFTDASALGWGAISIDSTGAMMQLSKRWTLHEMIAWNLGSSVDAEPLAVTNAVAALVTTRMRKVVIYTDHLPLVFVAAKTFGRAKAYSRMCTFFANYDVEFEVRFIAGSMNPADVLSRVLPPPPILEVTSIGSHGQPSKTIPREGESKQGCIR